jgi:hypothetical protein
MNPPIVVEVTRPNNHRMSRTTAMVYSMAFYRTESGATLIIASR